MSEWISVNDRLPKMKPTYLNGPLVSDVVVIYNGYIVSCGYVVQTNKRRKTKWQDRSGYRAYGVTHWMPVPEPPKEQ